MKQLNKLPLIIDAKFFNLFFLPTKSDIQQLIHLLNYQATINSELSPSALQWLSKRLDLLNDSLTDFKTIHKKSFFELSYFINIILPEAQRLTFFIKHEAFLKKSSAYHALFRTIEKEANNDTKYFSERSCNIIKKKTGYCYENSLFSIKKVSLKRTSNEGLSDSTIFDSQLRNVAITY